MPNSPVAKHEHNSSSASNDLGTYQEVSQMPEQYATEEMRSRAKEKPPPPPPERHSQEDIYPGIYDARLQAQRPSGVTGLEEGRSQPASSCNEREIRSSYNDRSKDGDRGQQVAGAGYGDSTRLGRDLYNARNRKNEGSRCDKARLIKR